MLTYHETQYFDCICEILETFKMFLVGCKIMFTTNISSPIVYLKKSMLSRMIFIYDMLPIATFFLARERERERSHVEIHFIWWLTVLINDSIRIHL